MGIIGLVNRCLPFATPGTPLIQDLLHLAVLGVALYYAPQIQAYIQSQVNKDENQNHTPSNRNQQPTQQNEHVHDGLVQTEADSNDNNNNNQQRPPRGAFVEDDSDTSDSDLDTNDDAPTLLPEIPQFGVPQQQPHPNGEPHQQHQPGQAAQPHPAALAAAAGDPLPSSSRTVGAKKAKSLAKKDQRRAYHEFMRSQGEAQRAREAEGAREREAQLAAERARRVALEAQVEEKRAKEREERREREAHAQREEMARRERALGLVRERLRERGMCEFSAVAREVGQGVDGVWIEKLVRASGMLGQKGHDGEEEVVMITETGWVVRVSKADMESAYRAMLERGSEDEMGRVSNVDLGRAVEDAVRMRVASVGV